MEIKGKVHCFFEQSGTFKNEFIKLGIPSEDYDIQNNFGQTDHTDDLFAEIEKAWEEKPSIFDKITKDDLIIAFFPCIYFCANNSMMFDGTSVTWRQQHKTEIEINKMILERSKKRQYFYEILLKFFSVCVCKKLRLIVENPYSTMHYLHNNFPYKPQIIDMDRTLRGDYFKKPTAYRFLNCKPTNGQSFQPNNNPMKIQSLSGHIGGICGENRSMISPNYARNFICDFILGKDQGTPKEEELW